ncbi:hypothetical protein BS47DRAFT_657297 [Hydnum rufescens UP504]|uniref:Uncharacterized protein n=1 Tax=Hydnum rufescens UP504 TaxID=1448309 RepID=A0A9P6B338_9AGAM|nr:hypothetical protein BS47DRAFT_657297 [Hydnum rufescens UP504]
MSRTRSNLGGFEVGMTASTVLFGVCTVQTVLYFSRFGKDPLLTRGLVMILWLLQGVQIVLMFGTIYWDLCTPPSALPADLWPDNVWQAFGIVISGLVQVFYSRLSHRLCRSWPLNVILDTLIVLKFVIGVCYQGGRIGGRD